MERLICSPDEFQEGPVGGDMTQILRRQIEQILDESATPTFDVIVQLRPMGTDAQQLIRQASRAAEARNAVVSSRDLAPPTYEQIIARRSADKEAGARGARTTAAATTSSRRRSPRPPGTVAGLTDLTKWAGQSRGGSRAAPVAFPDARSAALRISKDDLNRLTSEVDGVAAVFRNQRVTIPPVSRERGLPLAVSDNLAHVWGVSRTGAMACWGAFEARGKGVKVAVLDTGVDARHPDLDGKIADFAEFDLSGRMVKSGTASAHDRDGHGTHVAATIVGGRRSGRWIGMAPEAKLLSAMVLKNGEGSSVQVLAGMQWALDNGADVISMSLGALQMSAEVTPGIYDTMLIAAYMRGVPVVVAVGNEGAQTSSAPGNHFLAFTVGATDVDDLAAGFSGGRTQIVTQSTHISPRNLPLVYSKPDVSAPGVQIYSAAPKGKWVTLSGSSMATPHVSGAMALLLSCLPNLRDLTGVDKVQVLQGLLTSSVKELGESGQNHRFGCGRIDVLRACGVGLERGFA